MNPHFWNEIDRKKKGFGCHILIGLELQQQQHFQISSKQSSDDCAMPRGAAPAVGRLGPAPCAASAADCIDSFTHSSSLSSFYERTLNSVVSCAAFPQH